MLGHGQRNKRLHELLSMKVKPSRFFGVTNTGASDCAAQSTNIVSGIMRIGYFHLSLFIQRIGFQRLEMEEKATKNGGGYCAGIATFER